MKPVPGSLGAPRKYEGTHVEPFFGIWWGSRRCWNDTGSKKFCSNRSSNEIVRKVYDSIEETLFASKTENIVNLEESATI